MGVENNEVLTSTTPPEVHEETENHHLKDRDDEEEHTVQKGEASYYCQSLSGNPTTSGEPYDPDLLTAAHRTLPLGTRVRVTNLHTGASVVVRINDRGPFVENRVIDLSQAAAHEIGMIRRGVVQVRIERLPS